MKTWKRILSFLMTTAVLLFPSSDKAVSAPILEKEPTYVFHEHLSESQALLIRDLPAEREYETRRTEVKIGQWRDAKIIFEGLHDESEIFVTSKLYNGIEEKGIFLAPTSGKIKSLQYYEVTPASKMIIYYGIDDTSIEQKLNATIYMTIWIGEKKLKRLLISYQKGWHRTIIPLGVVSFFKKPIPVTLEITTDHPSARNFSFRAYMVD